MARHTSKASKTLRNTGRIDRQPKPTALDRLEIPPPAPPSLSESAVIEWDWLARATVETGVLCGCDLRALALLAETLAIETTLRMTIVCRQNLQKSLDRNRRHLISHGCTTLALYSTF
jgi:hypothetical protein